MYQPPPGDSSTTVIVGAMPKKFSVSYGWRYTSRSTLAGVRDGAATAARSALSSAWAAPSSRVDARMAVCVSFMRSLQVGD